MCGIAGINKSLVSKYDANALLMQMGEAIQHRGPDAGKQYVDHNIGLRHQRLSIIDTSDNGHQPMVSPSGRYITVYNGEIYNFKALRENLVAEGVKFRGHSDTEVLLALFEKHQEKCLNLLNGMFAMAIWDTHEESLFLARDRLGKKPLYYWQEGNYFGFASEIKALLKIPGLKKRLRPDAVKDYFTYQYVPDPKSIFENIHKLSPGHWMRIDKDGNTRMNQWWNVSFEDSYPNTDEQASDELVSLIEDSVKLRMISDVPLGAFLSGGVDSSAIVACMAKNSDNPVNTCSIGFESKEHDESAHAQQVADLYQTNHHNFMVKGDVEDELINIVRYFDEPFADASLLPTYFVSRMARQSVTVALAGDGGDESFGGYAKYALYERELRWQSKLPSMVRSSVLPLLVSKMRSSRNTTMQRATNLLQSLSTNEDDGFFLCNSFFREDIWQQLVKGDLARQTDQYDASGITKKHFNEAESDNPLTKALYTDIKTYLPGDILVKVDRMSMANSLECRAPLLDYRIVEFAASLPMSMKRRDGVSKFILKKSMGKLLPENILHRKKMGFESPIADWLRGSLRKTFENAVFSENSASNELFNRDKLTVLWQAHLGGANTYITELWSIFIFELWWQNYMHE